MERLIYDRTAEDVIYAKKHPSSSKKLKGAVNYTDLNRIELWSLYIQTLLQSIGITAEVIPVKAYTTMKYADIANKQYSAYFSLNYTSLLNLGGWKNTDSLTWQQMNRIRQNIDNLKNAFHINSDISVEFIRTMNYEQFNTLEKILYELNNNIENMKKNVAYSGTFRSGEQYIPY